MGDTSERAAMDRALRASAELVPDPRIAELEAEVEQLTAALANGEVTGTSRNVGTRELAGVTVRDPETGKTGLYVPHARAEQAEAKLAEVRAIMLEFADELAREVPHKYSVRIKAAADTLRDQGGE